MLSQSLPCNLTLSFPSKLLCFLSIATRLIWLCLFTFRTYCFTWYQSARVENLCYRQQFKIDKTLITGEGQKKTRMDKGISSLLLTAKLDRSNYAFWSSKCTSTCSSMATGVMSMELMTQHPSRHTEISRPGKSGKESSQLFCILCECSASKLHSGWKDAKRCLGKYEKDLRCEHHSQKAPTQARVEQCATTRYVGG